MKIKQFIAMVIMLLSSIAAANAQKSIDVYSKQAQTMLEKDAKMIVLDVRTPGEFNNGHIKGAINIDITQPDALSKINKLDRNAKYIVHCRTNRRSQIAVDHMLQNGFKTVFQMMDGITGWNQNSLPVVK